MYRRHRRTTSMPNNAMCWNVEFSHGSEPYGCPFENVRRTRHEAGTDLAGNRDSNLVVVIRDSGNCDFWFFSIHNNCKSTTWNSEIR